MDFEKEVKYRTARSGGKGGQNVNKVETMVEGYWPPANSSYFTEEEKNIIIEKLSNRINDAGYLLVKSESQRTQLANKREVIRKMNELVTKALVVAKKRKPSKVPKHSKEKRLENKQRNSVLKLRRQKPNIDE